MEKYYYKTIEYPSKIELMAANNLTASQFDSLLGMGRIQLTSNEDIVDFAGVYVEQNKYKYNGKEYRNMQHVCEANGFSKRKYSVLRKLNHIKSINNQNVAGYEKANSK